MCGWFCEKEDTYFCIGCPQPKDTTETSDESDISTLTSITEIPRDYFIGRDQIIKKDGNNAWIFLREIIFTEINERLTVRMIKMAQELDMQVSVGNIMHVVQSLKDIGRSWKQDSGIENAKKVRKVMIHQFREEKNFECKMEQEIMRDLRMVYTEVEETKQFKGCIARMITQRKVNICK